MFGVTYSAKLESSQFWMVERSFQLLMSSPGVPQ